MKILVSGSNGLIGSQLTNLLADKKHSVVRLVRGLTDTRSSGQVVWWDPLEAKLCPSNFDGIDAVVHLAGASVVGRWTKARKHLIRSSRVDGTRLLCETLARLESPPKILVSTSAIGLYGDRGEELMQENSTAGKGFLAEVASEWEQATEVACGAGMRVVVMRLGLVLTPFGGALAKMLPAFRCGLGGPLGSGNQYMSWVSLDDVLAMINFALQNDKLSGPFNVVAPEAVTNRVFSTTLAQMLRRPMLAPVPAPVLRLVFGREMAEQMLLSSTRVEPGRLLEYGFSFTDANLRSTFERLLR